MNVAFTLCSINYLAHAKTLYDSFKKFNPDWTFFIGLVDKNIRNIDLSMIECEIIEVSQLDIEGFDEMSIQYSIVELITSVKPYYFSYLIKTNHQANKFVYFDPDIMIFNRLDDLNEKLDVYDIILTPHFTTPIVDYHFPTEKHVFQTGVFNLGFLAIRRTPNSLKMIKWWESKLRNECYIDFSRGLFVDQLWMNLVPAYFDNVLIDKYSGYNMAHWNLHERFLDERDCDYFVNDVKLVFFHFSHYNPTKPDSIAAFHNRFSFSNRPDIVNIFEYYRQTLFKNGYLDLKPIKSFYDNNSNKKTLVRNVKGFLRRNVPHSLKLKLNDILQK